MVLYKGFSTQNYLINKSFNLNDIELIKSDILSHIWTRKGSRVKMPDFGTNLKDLIFEPLDVQTINTVKSEIKAVIDYDPRVELLNLTVQPLYNKNMLLVIINLLFVELNVSDNINLNIEFNGD